MLGYVSVGNNEASKLYVSLKLKACDHIGIDHKGEHFTESVTEEKVCEYVKSL